MRSGRSIVLLTVYLLILSGVTLLFYAAIADVSGSDLNAGRQIGKGLFLLIATVALIEVCLITPALTAGGIAGEKERQTYDLLVSSLLSPWRTIAVPAGASHTRVCPPTPRAPRQRLNRAARYARRHSRAELRPRSGHRAAG